MVLAIVLRRDGMVKIVVCVTSELQLLYRDKEFFQECGSRTAAASASPSYPPANAEAAVHFSPRCLNAVSSRFRRHTLSGESHWVQTSSLWEPLPVLPEAKAT